MIAVFIYALVCPVTGRIRYIGMSGNPDNRIKKHLREARVQKNHRADWIRSLLAQGLKPELEILAQVPELDWQRWEIDYIAAFRSMGFDLVNGTDGGEGISNPSKEMRAKIGARMRGNKYRVGHKNSPEQIEATRVRMLGNAHTLGHVYPPEFGEKISIRMLGNKLSTGKNIGNKHSQGRKDTLETTAKRQVAQSKRREKEAANKI